MTALEKDPENALTVSERFALALEQASQLNTLTSEQATKPAMIGSASVSFPPFENPLRP